MTVELINPRTGLRLEGTQAELRDAEGTRFPIVRGIPRICEGGNYADNFGRQWQRFSRTQLDDPEQGRRLSERRFFAETGWSPESLEGVDVLEVGSGAGRFSRVVLERTGARLWSVDYSAAVDANMAENGTIAPDRFNLFQASIYELPFADDSFDRVFCLGVLQHTPDFEASVCALIAKAKPGGEIVVDFYARRHALSTINAKYLLRPFSRRISHDRLMRLIDRHLDGLVAVADALIKLRLGALTRFVPLVDLRLLPAQLSKEQRREWALLDTFDMFSPQYDQPQRVCDVAGMFERHGARLTFAGYVDVEGARSAVVRGVKI